MRPQRVAKEPVWFMFQGKKKSPDIIAFIISIFIELATFRDRGGSVDTWIKKNVLWCTSEPI